MKLSIVHITVITVLVLLVLAVLSYKPMFDNPKTVFIEEPIQKNKEIQLLPGQQYIYSYMLNDSQINMTYNVLYDPTCVRIRLLESKDISESCLDRWGMDSQGYNSTLENDKMILFKPWMLALEEGWRWKVAMYLDYNGVLHHISESNYRVIRTDEYMNRTVFIVEITSQGGVKEYQWIDTEKRIALKIAGTGYEVILIEQS
ncbi:MAG: hypothetical protein ABID61_04625 [Candidatus Micrarchaeota archaeon]